MKFVGADRDIGGCRARPREKGIRVTQVVEHYATVLEPLPTHWHHLLTRQKRASSQIHAEDASEMADVYFAYGKVFLENAIEQDSVLGKEQ